MEKTKEPVMYFVVNDTLKMGKGKIAAQVAHAAIDVYTSHPDTDLFRWWRGSSHAKIVLRADQETLLALREKYAHITEIVQDEGRTQIEPGSYTVLGFRIMPKDSNPDLARLKLI